MVTAVQRTPIADQKQSAIFAILLLLLVCYTTFLTADVFTGNHNNTWSWIVKHIAGLLCFVLTLLIGVHGHGLRDRRLIQLALGLAVIGDLFMGFNKRLPGTAVFVLVQIVLIVRHSRGFEWRPSEWISALCVYVPIGVAFYALSGPMIAAGILLPAAIYTALLATSVWIGIGTLWRHFYVPTIARFVAIAVVAFFLCDLSLGLLNDKPQARGLEQIQEVAEIAPHPSFPAEVEPSASAVATKLDLPVDVAAPGPPSDLAGTLQGAADDFDRARVRAAEGIARGIPSPLVTGIGILIWFFYLPALALLAMSGYRLEYLRSILPVIPVRRR